MGDDDLCLARPIDDGVDARVDACGHLAPGFCALDAAGMIEPIVIRRRGVARIEPGLGLATRNAIADFPEIDGFHHRPLEAPCYRISRLGGAAQIGAMDFHVPSANQSHQPFGRCLRILSAAGGQIRVVPATHLAFQVMDGFRVGDDEEILHGIARVSQDAPAAQELKTLLPRKN
ncbi:hypothetical protein D9M70_562050 [compost metagenome]